MPKKIDNDALKNYVNEVENQPSSINGVSTQPGRPRMDVVDRTIKSTQNHKNNDNYGSRLEEARAQRKEEIQNDIHSKGLGWVELNPQDLPTRGLFYPTDIHIYIRAASFAEIRNWSQFDDTDFRSINNGINEIISRCTSIKLGDNIGSYKDLKEIDRFYVLLNIRDFTFPNGNNEVNIVVNETTQVPLKKENIDFIKFDDKIMRFYNSEKRCFTFKDFTAKNGQHISLDHPLNIFLPSVGVSEWLVQYYQNKQNKREDIDKVWFGQAPLIIPDYRNLNEDTYKKYAEASLSFGAYELALIKQFKKIISDSIVPTFTYIDKEGVEQHAPLNFQGGISSLFLPTVDELI